MANITIYTLAKELNMTPSMISRAFNPNAKINDEKRKIVLETAKKYNFSPNKFASRLSMNAVRIGVILNEKYKVNKDKMIDGIKLAHKGLKDYKIQYDVTVLNPTENTREDVIQTINKYKSFDGVIISGMSASYYTEIINELYEVNKNVVQVQTINQDANYLFASKHNEETSSRLAVEFLYNCLKKSESKNVVLFTGNLETTLHKKAEQSFKEYCKELGLNLLSSLDMKDDEEELEKIISKLFNTYGDTIDGIYITSGVSTPLCKYLDKNGYDIPFVAFDTHDDIKKYIQKGIITATISQDVLNQMQVAFELLVKHIIMGEVCPKTVYTDVQLVLKNNIHQFD